jgi:hypothetical protein
MGSRSSSGWQGGGVSTAQRYREFAREAHVESPAYERLALAVAEDGRLLGRLDQLPRPKRQPNLLFAAARYLGGPVERPAAFRDWVMRNWADLAATMLARSTQTNEPARCATLLPVLAVLPQPLALLEVGTSAGLCLYPDAYQYRYDGHTVGRPDSPVQIDCAVSGDVPLPNRVPDVVWRAGIDLNPLNAADIDDLRWLESLIWPGQPERVARLHAAVCVVKANPPLILRRDLLAELPRLAAKVPTDATLVVFHSAVLPYLSPEPARRSPSSSAHCPGTGSPTRVPTCCLDCSHPRHNCLLLPRAFSSPWMVDHSPSSHPTGRRCTGCRQAARSTSPGLPVNHEAWMPGDVPTGVVNVVILEVALRGCSRWFM